MKKHKIFWFVAIVLASITLGCVQGLNPDTGQIETVISPEAVVVIDAVAEAAPGLAALLALLVPAALPVSTLLVGAAGVWVKMKPKLTTARTEAEHFYSATESLVEAIEQFKADNPEEWVKLRSKLGENVGENTEAVIRAIRGLPLKD